MKTIKVKPIVRKLEAKISGIVQRNDVKGIAVLLGKEDPDAVYYGDSIIKKAGKLNIPARFFKYSNKDEFRELINGDSLDDYGGILALSPYPDGMSEKELEAIAPQKDVDCITSSLVGKLMLGSSSVAPATAAAVVTICRERFGKTLEGKEVVITGRSNRVGKPLVPLFLGENATVKICHSRTKELPRVVSKAHIAVLAIGRAEFFDRKYFSEGQTVIDVGINKKEDGFCGDANRGDLTDMTGHITKVPGGVGSVTTVMIFVNLLKLQGLWEEEL